MLRRESSAVHIGDKLLWTYDSGDPYGTKGTVVDIKNNNTRFQVRITYNEGDPFNEYSTIAWWRYERCTKMPDSNKLQINDWVLRVDGVEEGLVFKIIPKGVFVYIDGNLTKRSYWEKSKVIKSKKEQQMYITIKADNIDGKTIANLLKDAGIAATVSGASNYVSANINWRYSVELPQNTLIIREL